MQSWLHAGLLGEGSGDLEMTNRGAQALREPGEAIGDQAPGDGYVEARAVAHHGDLHALVDVDQHFVGYALVLVAEQQDGRPTRRRQPGERGGAIGEFDGDDALAGRTLLRDPALLARLGPVDAWAASTEGVADLQRLLVVRRPRDGEAGADRIAGAQQGAEVRAVGDPERRDDEMVPQLWRPGRRWARRSRGLVLAPLMGTRRRLPK